MNIQGRLLDATGSPAPAGLKGFTFKIWNAPTGGVEIWPAGPGELQTVTTGLTGLWTASIGALIPLPGTVFLDSARWLEITVNDGVNPPETLGRLPLKSTPYTFRAASSQSADSLAGNSLGDLVDRFVDVTGDQMTGGLSLDFGNDGTLDAEIREAGGPAADLALYDTGILTSYLYGDQWGELLLHDQDGDLTVDVTATSISGGKVFLNQEDGTAGIDLVGGSTSLGSFFRMRNAGGSPTIELDAAQTGDAAAVLPAGAVSSAEILNESGLAYDEQLGEVTLTSSIGVLNTRSIVAPSSGYVFAIATMGLRVNHAADTNNNVFFGISTLPTTFSESGAGFVLWLNSIPPGTRIFTQTVHDVFPVSAGTNTFYLVARASVGDARISSRRLTLLFVPSAYGTVSLAGAVSPTPPDLLATERAVSEQANMARIERELAEIQSQRDDLQRRLESLEAAVARRTPVNLPAVDR